VLEFLHVLRSRKDNEVHKYYKVILIQYTESCYKLLCSNNHGKNTNNIEDREEKSVGLN